MKKSKSIGEGHGKKGNFLGLEGSLCSRKNAKIAILPVPFDKTTTYQKGTDKGPSALIEASRNLEVYDVETDSEAYLNGIYTAPAVRAKTSKQMLESVYKRTKELINEGKFVVTLGGEHSISYAPIRAHLEKYKKLTLLQFDAHADLASAYEGNPLSHASVIARVKELKGIEKIVSVGIRSVGLSEYQFLDRKHTFFAHEIVDDPQWIDRLVDMLIGNIYITFDLDFFDCSLMPSTGTPEPGGLFWYDAMKLLRRVAQKKRVVGCDVVELLPNPRNRAPDFLAAKLVYKILSYQFQPKKKK